VLGMLSTGNTEAVTARINQFPEDSEDRASAAFYGNFYLGLYADAAGDKAKAKSYLDEAAKDAPHHYMGDLARVYAQQLAK
jgi:lipoprotein NlpI